ncbi:MAG TPA: glycosyltransferase [Candidatus Saccharimonadales bacterium]|nr:glycosyltransferase [Candidatus Saccharimonadales bacterium]
MKLALIILAVASILEILLWLPPIWKVSHKLSYPLVTVVVGSSIAIFILHPRLWSVVLLIIGLYRGINLCRIIKARMHEKYLKRVTQLTSLWLMVYQLLVLLILQIMQFIWVHYNYGWLPIASLQFAIALMLILSLRSQLHKTRNLESSYTGADQDLPTLSVAIPARNETDDLEACLRTLLDNTYPKLEILVLDDCSQNTRTPEIIRSFAHDGVRFIAGTEPDGTWLAKNYAYERLSEEANGDVILFCGVDTRFTPGALRNLVNAMLESNRTMISVMPLNMNFSPLTAIVQPLRYAWELALPRNIFHRPAVLSTCWIVRKEELSHSGSFKAVSRAIVPESYFARIASVNSKYAFVRSIDVMSYKSFSEQKSTAIRTRYPQLHRRPEQVAAVAFGSVFFLISPFVLFGFMVAARAWLAAGITALNCIGLLSLYGKIVNVTYRRSIVYAPLLMPAAIAYDLALMHYSMLKYEFSKVVWKGRNICVPVMHVVPSLPKSRQ